MSPILVRPVREQLEHDRVIRLLQAKYKRKFDVAMNPGQSQIAPVGNGPNPWYPDLVLQAAEKTRKLHGVVEVETAESVNHLEAMSQWAAFSRLRVLFYLYVPAASVDTARRLCADLKIPTDEIWAYHTVGDQLRFALIQRSEAAEAAAKATASSPADEGEGASARPRPKRLTPPSSMAPTTPRTAPVAARPAAPSKPSGTTSPAVVKPVVSGRAAGKPVPPKALSPKPGAAQRVAAKPVASRPQAAKSAAPKAVVAKKAAPAKLVKAAAPVKATAATRKPATRALPRKAVKRTAGATRTQKRK